MLTFKVPIVIIIITIIKYAIIMLIATKKIFIVASFLKELDQLINLIIINLKV